MPRTHRRAGIVEYAHEFRGEERDVARPRIHVRPRYGAGGGTNARN